MLNINWDNIILLVLEITIKMSCSKDRSIDRIIFLGGPGRAPYNLVAH